ncbi:GNAT family N-acetyltransferase [bacterium]|nr:GNAT family N-acetyltransferase [bacterium]
MSEDKYQWIANPGPEEWDQVIQLSPQSNLFCERFFLEAAGVRHQLYLVKQGEHIKAGVCVVKGQQDNNCVLDDLVIHNGILFLNEETKKQVRLRFEQFELTEFIIQRLTSQFETIELALAPQFEDLRPFIWHCYHESDKNNKFTLDLRYTTYVDVSELGQGVADESSAAFLAMDTLRQRHIRQAHKQGGTVQLGKNSQLLVGYYRDLMVRQGDPSSEDKLVRMARVIDQLIAAGRGALYEVVNSQGVIVYTVFYAWDSKRAYYLFGAGHPEHSELWQGTLAHWGAFKNLSQNHHVKEVDLEGVNSPNRGWFKLSFGGNLKSYYQVYKNK